MTKTQTIPTAYGARVLVQRDAEEETTAGGIVLAKQHREEKHSGVVLNAGHADLQELVGQRVAFLPFQTIDLGDEDDRWVAVPEDAIVAVLGEGA